MIKVTAAAAEAVKNIMGEQGLSLEDHYLRCGVKGGGCSGFQYDLDVTNDKQDTDEEFESEGLRILCDPKSHIYLDGTEIDYKSTLMGGGFVFSNPNATGCCGCGQSFCA
jgi:iron-sulfur cluster assembly protein